MRLEGAGRRGGGSAGGGGGGRNLCIRFHHCSCPKFPFAGHDAILTLPTPRLVKKANSGLIIEHTRDQIIRRTLELFQRPTLGKLLRDGGEAHNCMGISERINIVLN